jgi:hypothetical protein
LDKLTELVRTGGKPVLERHGFTRVKRGFVRRSETGDILIVSFENGATAPRNTAAEIDAGYSPRYQQEWFTHFGSKPGYVPHPTACLFNWRVAAPAAASYAPERGQPWGEWWALGERTAKSAEILPSVLADDVVPELVALEALDAQLAMIAEPLGKISVHSPDWEPVFALLGRAPRAQVEDAIDAILHFEMLAEATSAFRAWAHGQLDAVYGPRVGEGDLSGFG